VITIEAVIGMNLLSDGKPGAVFKIGEGTSGVVDSGPNVEDDTNSKFGNSYIGFKDPEVVVHAPELLSKGCKASEIKF
jgi:hypothetical protein